MFSRENLGDSIEQLQVKIMLPRNLHKTKSMKQIHIWIYMKIPKVEIKKPNLNVVKNKNKNEKQYIIDKNSFFLQCKDEVAKIHNLINCEDTGKKTLIFLYY